MNRQTRITAIGTGASAVLLLGVVKSFTAQDDVPAAKNNIEALSEAFGDEAIWGIPRGHRLQTRVDPTVDDMLQLAVDAAKLTESGGVLVVYFAGHAQVRGGNLYLSPPRGDPDDPQRTMLGLDRLVEHLGDRCEARQRLLILDCCHAGAGADSLRTELQNVDEPGGWLLLAATGRRPVAAGTGEHTPFTSYLLRTLQEGCGTEASLSPDTIMRNIEDLAARDPEADVEFPVTPRTNGVAWASLPWVRNVAYAAPEASRHTTAPPDSHELQPIPPERPLPPEQPARPAPLCRPVHHGRPFGVELHRGKLRSTDSPAPDADQLVSADGAVLALVEGAQLHACLVGADGDLRSMAPTDLTRLGQGTVLAVARSGLADLALLWADLTGTHVVRVLASTGALTALGTMSADRASAGVLGPARALLVDGHHRCPAFPGATITRIAAASSGGRTLVLATGTDEQGESAAWLEIGGSNAHRLEHPGAHLQITHGSQRPPAVLDATGLPVPTPAPGAGRTRWSRWTPIGPPTAPVPA